MSTNFSFSAASSSSSTSSTSFGSTGNNQQQGPITGQTLFESLPQELQTNLVGVQRHLHTERVISEEIAQRKSFYGKSAQEDIAFLTDRVGSLKNSVLLFSEKVQLSTAAVETATKNAEVAMRAIERLKTPYSQRTELPAPYFWSLLADFEERMLQYRQVIADIEKFLDSRAHQRQYSPQMLKDIMQSQYQFFISLASQVAQLRDSVEDFKSKFLQYRKKYHDDSNDPFAEKKEPRNIPRFRPQPLIHLQQQQQQQQQQQNQGNSSGGGFSFGGSSSGGGSSGGGFSFGSQSSGGSSGGGFSFGSQSSSGGSSGSGGGFSFGGNSQQSSSGSGGGGFSFGSSQGSSGGGGGFNSQSSGGGFSFGGQSSGGGFSFG